jgi:hypothetical protein
VLSCCLIQLINRATGTEHRCQTIVPTSFAIKTIVATLASLFGWDAIGSADEPPERDKDYESVSLAIIT